MREPDRARRCLSARAGRTGRGCGAEQVLAQLDHALVEAGNRFVVIAGHASATGLTIIRDGMRDLRLWDGVTFLLRKGHA